MPPFTDCTPRYTGMEKLAPVYTAALCLIVYNLSSRGVGITELGVAHADIKKIIPGFLTAWLET